MDTYLAQNAHIELKGGGSSNMTRQTTGYVPGGFDMFHIGHLNILRAARQRCDRLIVGVATDESLSMMKNREPVIPHAERMEIVSHLRFVDEVVPDTTQDKNHPPQWWSQLMDILKDEHGITTVFMPVFLDARYLDDYSGISYAMGDWGLRNPGHVVAAPDRAAQAHALNSRWIAPVSVQDVRPSQGVFWESDNLRNLRATWARAIEDDADFVLLVTWNDYSESTSFAPSMAHGYVFLDVSAYYATWFKTGSAPTIVRDAMYVTHRTQPFGAEPTLAHRLMVLQHGNRNPAQDAVEVQTFFTAEAQVRVQIGSAAHTYTAPAGVYVRSFPLVHGSVEASALRDGRPIAVVASPFEVTLQPDNQDLQYYAVSSRR